MRNTYATYLVQGYSSGKLELTPHNIVVWHHTTIKTSVVQDGHAFDKLVGSVMDYQDDDQ